MSVSNLAASAVASQQNQLQSNAALDMLKAGQQQEMAVANMLQDSVAKNAALMASPPPGTGLRLDTTA